MNIILLRHGESVDDILDCYGGAADYPLSENGIETAKELARSLRGEDIEHIYSSPMKRAFQTASIIQDLKECDISVIYGIKERNSYGVMSGCSREISKDIYGYILETINGKAGDYYSDELVLGAEPVDIFDDRVRIAMYDIINDAMMNGYKSVAVVTHGNVTRSIYKNLLHYQAKIGLDLLARTWISFDNDMFIVYKREGVIFKDG